MLEPLFQPMAHSKVEGRMRKFTIWMLVGWMVLSPIAADAEGRDWDAVKLIPSGTTVRIVGAGHIVIAKVQSVDDNQITITKGGDAIVVERQAIVELAQRGPGNAGKATLIGFGAGATIGGVLAGAAADYVSGPQKTRIVASAMIGYGVLGALIGFLKSHPGDFVTVYRRAPPGNGHV
ncbi:MAG TPA: hypothetical protein VGZ27_09255 [Vicinamibacterales bacterium]|jgi:hypothetical protein|nr:hypothetical protein [Vicinamibacterales bacterium]